MKTFVFQHPRFPLRLSIYIIYLLLSTDEIVNVVDGFAVGFRHGRGHCPLLLFQPRHDVITVNFGIDKCGLSNYINNAAPRTTKRTNDISSTNHWVAHYVEKQYELEQQHLLYNGNNSLTKNRR